MRLILLLLTLSFYTQIPKSPDSLWAFLKTHPKDTSYVLAQSDLVFQKVREGDFKDIPKILKEMDEISHRLDFGLGIYRTMNMRGVVEYSSQKPQKALIYFLKCDSIINKYNLSNSIRQNYLNNLGIIYNQMGNREMATKYATNLIQFQEKHKLKPLKSWPYDQMGLNLKFLGRYEEALVYLKKSLAIEVETSNLSGMAIAENHLGNIYDDMKNTIEAISYFEKGLEHAEAANYKLLQTDLLTNLGSMYRKLGKYSKSEFYLKKSEALCRELEAIISLKTVCHNLGNLYYFQNNFSLSEKYYLEALELAQKSADVESLYTANQALAELYETTGDFKKAYQFKVAGTIAKDSVFKIETAQNTENLLRKYEADKRLQEIALLNAQNEKRTLQNKFLIAGAIGIFLLAVLIILYLINRSKLHRLKESEALRNRIASDLHDEIGSTLSSIMLLSEMAQKNTINDPVLLKKINDDSRTVMESVDEIIWSINPVNDTFQEILLRIKEFAIPLLESKEIKFQTEYTADAEKTELPMIIRRNLYLIIKEAVNNAAKYSEGILVTLEVKIDRNRMLINIRDDGKGFDTELSTNRNGFRNMRLRCDEMNGKLGITSSESGTCISVEILLHDYAIY